MFGVYGLLFYEVGGVLNDLIANKLRDERFNLVVHTSNKHEELAYLR